LIAAYHPQLGVNLRKQSKFGAEILFPGLPASMYSNAVAALAVMKWAKRNCVKVISALTCALPAANVMNLSGAFAELEVSADDTAECGHARKMFFFCLGHAAPPA